jgi:hypothetical protein
MVPLFSQSDKKLSGVIGRTVIYGPFCRGTSLLGTREVAKCAARYGAKESNDAIIFAIELVGVLHHSIFQEPFRVTI